MGIGNMFGQVKQKGALLKDLMQKQKELKQKEANGFSKNGLVAVKLNGLFDMVDIKIDESLLDPTKYSTLKKSIKQAYKDARKQIEKAMRDNMGDFKDLLNI